MIIKRIILENIRSYEKAEIEFPLGSVLLEGDIGSGKTTILLAIEFALFGLQPGKKGSSLLRNGEREGKVVLEIEVDGKNVIIERNLKASSKGVNQSNCFIIVDNEKKELSTTELKNLIIQILNYPKEFIKKTNILYRFTVYTPQEEMKQIILEPAELRLDTLRHIFGIDKYKRVKENLAIIGIKLREIIKNYEGQIMTLEEEKTKKEEKKKDIEKIRINLKEEELILKEKKEKRKNIEKEIEELTKKIKEKENYEKEAEKIRVMLIGKKEIFSSKEKEKEEIEKEITNLKLTKFSEEELFNKEKEKQSLEKEKEEKSKGYLEITGRINSIKLKIEEIKKQKDQISILKVCPTCLQEIKEEYKVYVINNFEYNIIQLKKELEEKETEKKILGKRIEEINKKIFDIEKEITNLKLIKIKLKDLEEKERKLEKIKKEISIIKKDIEMLDSQLKNLLEIVSSFKKYENLFDKKNSELKDALKEEKNSEIVIAELEKEIDLLLKIVKEIEKSIEEKMKLKEKLNYVKEIENWLSTNFLDLINFIERNIMLKLIEEFSKLFNEWFNLLVPENFSVKLDETFTPIIEQNGYTLDYDYMSGGERTAVALSYRLALNQILNSLHSKIKTKEILILDEPTDGFSEQQLEKMRDVFEQLKAKQIIIVSHENKMEDFVENIISFKKENGISKIEKKDIQ